MSCERFENQIPSLIEGTLVNPQKLEDHLSTCPICEQKANDLRSAHQALTGWSDEPVPPWNRAPIGFFNQKRPNLLWSWGPLILATVLFGFVLFNVQVTVRPEGTTIQFSKSPNQTALTQDLVDQLEKRDEAYKASIENLLKKYQTQQDVQVQTLVRNAIDQNDQQFKKNLETLNENWKAQREVDNRYWSRQIQSVYKTTSLTYDNLNLLASHIQNK